jgi:hypothetical protein
MAEVAFRMLPSQLNPQNNSFLPATKQCGDCPPTRLLGGCHNVRSRSPVRMLYTSVQDAAGPSWCIYAFEL